MNLKENQHVNNNNCSHVHEEIGDAHWVGSTDTPLREDAFDLSDEQKMAKIEPLFKEIMHTLGLDMKDDSLKGTPYRVSKMFVKEIFSGLKPENKPFAKTFDNSYQYNEMLVEKDISVFSTCEHHFLPIIGRAHVAYISSGKVVGLSKINRIVNYYSRRPQVQERLTMQIAEELQQALDTDDVAVIIEARHFCVMSRGINDVNSTTLTAEYRGAFKDPKTKENLLQYIRMELNK